MPAMIQADRDELHAELNRDHRVGPIPNVVKADLIAAIAAADDWVVANQTSFNNALPAAFKTNANTTQKALLLMLVLAKRYVKGS